MSPKLGFDTKTDVSNKVTDMDLTLTEDEPFTAVVKAVYGFVVRRHCPAFILRAAQLHLYRIWCVLFSAEKVIMRRKLISAFCTSQFCQKPRQDTMPRQQGTVEKPVSIHSVS
jgi:hypothetical protein